MAMRTKVNITTPERIEATKYMLEFTEDKAPVIAGICEANQLTKEFVNEFRNLMTKQMFTLSYRLTIQMIDAFPDLFDEVLFKEVYKYTEEEIAETEAEKKAKAQGTNSSLNSMLQFLLGNTGAQLVQQQMNNQNPAPANQSDDEEEKEEELPMLSKKRLTMGTLARYFSVNETELDVVLSIIRNSTIEEMTDSDVVSSYIGFDNTIDDVLLMRIQDNDIKNSIIMKKFIDNNQITPSGFRYIDSETREIIIGTDNVDIATFIKGLSLSNDLGWQIKMVNKIKDEDMSFQNFKGTLDEELLLLVANLPEDLVVKLTALAEYAPSIFSYKVLHWALLKKEFSEQQLINMKDLFVKAGMKFELRNFAKNHEYNNLLAEV